jgi:hypothetical protein
VFWAIVGGIGASLLLPAMQSLIHGELRRRDAEEGLRPRRRGGGDRATVGPLLGGFITTFPGGWASRSRLSFIAVVLSGIRLVRDVPYEGDRGDAVGVLLSVAGMGGVVLGVLV